MYCSYQKSIFVFVLFASVYIVNCAKGKNGGGAKKEYNAPGGAATEDNDYGDSDGISDFTDNPDTSHKKLKSTNSSKSRQKSHGKFLIGGFNMHKFGFQKIKSNPNLLNAIVRIVMRYDLLAISEITDRKQEAIQELMEQVNQKSKHLYNYSISPRIGRSKSKEQYAIIYRAQRVQLKVEPFLYDDMPEDNFTREPYIAQIALKGREEAIGLVVIHIKPTEAVKEINALADVQDWIEDNWKIKDVIIIGDLNADCTYVRKKDWSSINLRNQDKFLWLIGDDVDTTVAPGSRCAYDRIVISGDFLQSAVIPKSGRPFKFDRQLHLEDREALQVSDHYPVEFAIRLNETVVPASTSGGLSISVYYNAPIFIPSQLFYLLSIGLSLVGVLPGVRPNPLW